MKSGVFIVGYSANQAAEKLAVVPGEWRERVRKIYAGKREKAALVRDGSVDRFAGEYAADEWLAGTADRMRAVRVPLTISDSELCQLARECAAACLDIAFRPGTVTDTGTLRANMAGVVTRYGLLPPPVTVTDTGAIKRMGCDIWWRRRLRVAQGRAIEREAITLGYVHKNREIYASTVTVERRRQQKRRNAAALENTAATNQHGQEFTLAQLAEKAVSNPRIRRGELMTRIAGFESIARGLEHVGMFFTVTCPSRMHAKKQIRATGAVFDNPKYDRTTPREAQQYLTGMWAKCRAALARVGALVYGFRIAEPHHDGAPHWHLLLFMAKAVAERVTGIFCRYACETDAGELTSETVIDARFLAKVIDWSRGTAAGYIAKYVSKNIDGGGYQVQCDIEGSDRAAFTPSHRVEAWASAWGIRQFQQIGGAPVGVWRELRRLKDSDALTDTVRDARGAADVGNWHRYNEVQGGTNARRKDRPVGVAYTREGERYSADRAEMQPAPATRYGEQAPKAVYGVRDCRRGRAFVTRVYQWEVTRNGSNRIPVAARLSGEYVGEFRWVSDRIRGGGGRKSGANGGENQSAFAGDGGGLVFELAQLVAPWTRVNNCTEDSDYDFSGEGVCLASEGEKRALCAKFGADPRKSKAGDRRNGGDSGGGVGGGG